MTGYVTRGRAGVVAVAGCAVLLVLSGCVGTSGPSGTSAVGEKTDAPVSGIIPFAAIRPAHRHTPSMAASDSAAPVCAASALSATGTGGGGAGGDWYIPVTITNEGATTCGFPVGDAGVSYVAPGSTDPTVVTNTITPWSTRASTMRLKPGESFRFLTSTADCVGGAKTVTPVSRFDLMYRGTAIAVSGTKPPVQSFHCGAISAEVQEPQPATTPGTQAALTVKLEAPPMATAGSTLRFNVALDNPTNKPVSLATCPDYTESVLATSLREPKLRKTYGLNCDGLASIPADSSETFAMKLPIPAGMTGTAKLSWQLTGGNGAGSVLSIHS